MRWIKVWAIVLAVAASAASAAERKYEIKLTRPMKVGAVYRLSGDGAVRKDMTVQSGDEILQRVKEERRFALDASVKVLEVDKHGEETKVSMTINKCVQVKEEGESELLAKGTVVVGRAEGLREVFEVEGRPVTPDAGEALDLLISLSTGGATDDEVFGTRNPRSVGESWGINAAAAAKDARRNGILITEEEIKGRMTLEKAVKVGDTECLQIRGTLTVAKVPVPGLPPGMKVRKGEVRVVVSGLFPVDTSLPRRTSDMEQTVHVTTEGQAGPEQPVTTVDAVMKRTSNVRITPAK